MSGVRILVVEGSAVMREAISRTLRQIPGAEVCAVADAVLAEARLGMQRPDVVVVDVESEALRGLDFIERNAGSKMPPVVVIAARKDGAPVARALSLGVNAVVERYANEVVNPLSWARVIGSAAGAGHGTSEHATCGRPILSTIVIGASTGGTHALRRILSVLHDDCPPTLVVQHIVPEMTESFVASLGACSAAAVKLAVHGDAVMRGRVLVAPGGRHLRLSSARGASTVELDDEPARSGHRPSVNVLFESAVQATGAGVVAVLLTGMGDDGVEGMAQLHHAGATTIAQDESTSVVFGMPKRAIERGVVDLVLPLEAIGHAMVSAARHRAHRVIR